MDDCAICAKHRGRGSLAGVLVCRAQGFWVYHAPADDVGTAPLGYLFIESDRHAPYLSDLTDREAAALGRLRTAIARGLRQELDVEFVFSAVIGTGVAHFHEHVFARHREGTDELPWYRAWEDAPRAGSATVLDLAARLARRVRG